MAIFGKFMNNYYYGKSGKGDFTEEDLPKDRKSLFFEMLRIRFSALIRLNLIYLPVWLPAMIWMMINVVSLLTALSGIVDGSSTVSFADAAYSSLFYSLLVLFPLIAITGPCSAGITYVARNWARDEHAFIWADFKDAVKANWKQALICSVIDGAMPFLLFVCWNFYRSMAAENSLMLVPQALIVLVGLVWAISRIYFYPLIITYDLKFSQLMRNTLLLGVGRLPGNVAVALLHLVPALIAAVVLYFTGSMWAIIGLFLYYLLFGFSLYAFVTVSYTNGVFDKYINSHIEGVETNRGLRKPDDDEDDEDDEEDEQGER